MIDTGEDRVDGLSPERLLEFANTRSDRADREALIDLAGHWKHGYIPLDAVAWAIKMKHQRGDGKRRRGIGDQSHLEPYHGGRAGGPSKSRLDPKGAAQHAGIIAGTRSKGKPRAGVRSEGFQPPREPYRGPSSHSVDPSGASHPNGFGDRGIPPGRSLEQHAGDVVRMKAPELKQRAASGDRMAAAELDRRASKRAAKTSGTAEDALHAKYAAAKTPREKELAASNLAEHYRAAGKATPAKNWQRTAEKHQPGEPAGASTPEHIKAMSPEQMRAELAPKPSARSERHARAQETLKAIGENPSMQGKPGNPQAGGADPGRAPVVPSSSKPEPPAAPPVKPKRKPSALIQEYRSRREEQDRRFEAHTGGGVAAQDTHTQEYKDYFGVGDHSTTPQEQRLTYKGFLEERRQASEHDRRLQAAYDHGAKLGAKHGIQEDTTHHEAEYRDHAAGHDGEMFGQGYSDGILAAADKADKQQKADAYETARKAAGDATSASHRAPSEASHKTAGHAHIAAGQAALAHGDREQARYHVAQAQIHADASKRARIREEADRLRSDPAAMSAHLRERSIAAGNPQTDEEKAAWARDRNIGMRVLDNKRDNPADWRQVAASKWTSDEMKAAANRKLAQHAATEHNREYARISNGPMSKMSNAELAQFVKDNPLHASQMTQPQKRAVAQFLRERANSAKVQGKPAKETPEEVAKRIGMEFVKPTLKGHAVVGEGATVEKAAPRAGDFTTGHAAELAKLLEPGSTPTHEQAMRHAPFDVVNARTGARYTVTHASSQNIGIRSSDGYTQAHPITQHVSGDRILSGYRHAPAESAPSAPVAPAGVRGHTEAELRHQAATPDTRMGARAAAELERRGLPAEPHLTTRLAASQSHPLGATVDAKQPGIDRTTRGVVAGHTPEGMVRVAYKDHRGDTTTGTFNPAHTTVVSKPAEGGNVSSLGEKRAERGPSWTRPATDAQREANRNEILSAPPVGTTRLTGNQSIVINGPNAGKITDPSAPAGEARRFGEAANAGQRANIGQAQAEARKAAQGPPKQGEMFGATGEHQPDIFEAGQPSAAGRDTSSNPNVTVHRDGNSWVAQHSNGTNTASVRVAHNPTLSDAENRAKAEKALERGGRDTSTHPGIRVEHSGDGTVVYGTQRGDTETTDALKGQGFKWSRSLGGWYLPRTWSASTRELRVRGLEARLGNKIEVQRGDLGRSGTAAERAQATVDRAKEIADQQRARAEKFRQESAAQDAAARRISDNIPFGQPILVGHHSQRRAEKDQERIHNGMRRSIEADSNARAAEQRANSAEARARMQTDPRAAARRLERSEAELRSVERKLNGTGKEIHGENHPATGEYAARLKARHEELTQSIAHDRGIAGDLVAGPTGEAKYGRHNVKPGDVVKVRGSSHVVHSTGPKNAKLMTEVGPLAYPYSQITAHGPLEDASTETLRKMLANSDRIASFGNTPRAFPPAVTDRIKSILRSRGEG